jgi:hypothetical protein
MRLFLTWMSLLVSLDLVAYKITCDIHVMPDQGNSELSNLYIDENHDYDEKVLSKYRFKLYDLPPFPGSPARILQISKPDLVGNKSEVIANLYYPNGRTELYPDDDIIIIDCISE